MLINQSCFPFDPIERTTTQISNLAQAGFNQRQIKQRLFGAWLACYKKYPNYQTVSASRLWRRMYQAQAAYNGKIELEGADGSWSDHIAWIYTEQWEQGEYYETVIYPEIKKNVDILEYMAVMDQYELGQEPERRAYGN